MHGHNTAPFAFLDEADTLIMSPALFERRPVRRLDDIASHVLLSTETRPGDWTDWLDRAGLRPAAEQRRRVFDHFFVTRQAVVDGFGLGIGPLPVLQADLTAGCLLAPVCHDHRAEEELRCPDSIRRG
jgi:LysR family glycine cleavage system transcriptional activator